MQTILHPTDFSDCSRHAFRLVEDLARQHGARVVVLHVNQQFGRMLSLDRSAARLRPGADEQMLWEALLLFQLKGCDAKRVQHLLTQGDPIREILRVAQECEADAIVMGTHGWTGVQRLLLGSVSEQVLQKAGCTVVTVKMPEVRHKSSSAVAAGRAVFDGQLPRLSGVPRPVPTAVPGRANPPTHVAANPSS